MTDTPPFGAPPSPAKEDDPDYSITRQGLLVAYVWYRTSGGTLQRSGRGRAPMAEVPFADIRVFDAATERVLLEILPKCQSLDSLRFKMGIEGYEVHTGRASPTGQVRRF